MEELIGMRWGYAFLNTDMKLPEEERMYLVGKAILMYLEGKEEKKIETDNLEGIITTDKKFYNLGCFSGQKFKVEIDSNYGRSHMEFLISEQTFGNISYSLN